MRDLDIRVSRVWLVAVLSLIPACGDDGATSVSATETTAGTASTTTTMAESASSTTVAAPITTGVTTTQTSSGSTEAASSGTTGGGLCDGPEHEEFQKALCPDPYPSCTPTAAMLPPTYCQDMGFGPVGSGECACTPKPTLCGIDGSDEMISLCCCWLEELETTTGASG